MANHWRSKAKESQADTIEEVTMHLLGMVNWFMRIAGPSDLNGDFHSHDGIPITLCRTTYHLLILNTELDGNYRRLNI